MKPGSILILVLAVLILNAGITLVLLNQKNILPQPDTKREVASRAEAASRETTITTAVEAVEPAVVSVNVTKTELVRGSRSFGFFDFFDFFPMERQVQSIGSGVIYDKRGFIVTNAHVVSGATEITIVLPDKREFSARVIGADDQHDIAKLKIEGNNLPAANFGNSKNLIIGEWAIALGNPYGFLMNDSKPSVSVGVISAVGRSFAPRRDGRTYRNMIQTDAAVNPGNSGGPLVNIKGEVIGINTFIFSESGGNIGIGFALPIDTVREVLERI